jgi:hypothetical protein
MLPPTVVALSLVSRNKRAKLFPAALRRAFRVF